MAKVIDENSGKAETLGETGGVGVVPRVSMSLGHAAGMTRSMIARSLL